MQQTACAHTPETPCATSDASCATTTSVCCCRVSVKHYSCRLITAPTAKYGRFFFFFPARNNYFQISELYGLNAMSAHTLLIKHNILFNLLNDSNLSNLRIFLILRWVTITLLNTWIRFSATSNSTLTKKWERWLRFGFPYRWRKEELKKKLVGVYDKFLSNKVTV